MASSWEMPSRQVTSSRVIIASTFWSRFLSKRTSRLVRMPTSRPSLRHRDAGDLVLPHQLHRAVQRRVGLDGDRIHHHAALVLLDLGDLERLLLGWSRFLWMTPMPPSWAMAMAVRASVTVSMAALTRGMCRRRLRVSWAPTSTSRGSDVALGRQEQDVVEGESKRHVGVDHFSSPMRRASGAASGVGRGRRLQVSGRV